MSPKPTEKHLTIAGKPYCWLEYGQGKSLVILHGLGGSKECMVGLLGNLTQCFHCYFLDLPGHNRLPAGSHRTLTDFSDYVLDFINHRKLQDFFLLGFSFGGTIVLDISNRRYRLDGQKIPTIAWSAPLSVRDLTLTAKLALIISRLAGKKFTAVFLKLPAFLRLLKFAGIKLSPVDYQALFHFDITLLKHPVRLLFNNSDLTLQDFHFIISDPADRMVRLNSLYPLANIAVIKKGGHYGTSASWQKATRAIFEFLNQ